MIKYTTQCVHCVWLSESQVSVGANVSKPAQEKSDPLGRAYFPHFCPRNLYESNLSSK